LNYLGNPINHGLQFVDQYLERDQKKKSSALEAFYVKSLDQSLTNEGVDSFLDKSRSMYFFRSNKKASLKRKQGFKVDWPLALIKTHL
jgi:hypothetical protein